ncbi:glycosyltransferase family 2 protein [Patescibacteria group bacterium]|nr:glycosyltransferase family 2 protein [Patescibacteria group bacterium]
MSSSLPRIAVVIVGYNSRQYLPECLETLFASRYLPEKVFFLSNGSQDGSVEYIKENFPQVDVTEIEDNIGFAAGNNLLIQKALAFGVDAILLLNPDTVISATCLQLLARAYRPDTIWQPLVLLHEKDRKTKSVNSYGNPLHFLGFSYAGGNRQPMPAGRGGEITLASGAAVLIPRAVFERIGIFEECFFMYHEDVDFSWRARMSGYNIRSLYSAQVWHKYAYSRNSRKFYYVERNRLLFILKNYEIRTILFLLPFGILTELFLLLYSITQKAFWAKLFSWGGVIALLPYILKKRASVQRFRTMSDKNLARFMITNLRFSELKSWPVDLYNLLSKLYWVLIRRSL